MQFAGKSKVTRLSAKTGITYPLIRLPKEFADEIGKTALMYEDKQGSSRSLLITFLKSESEKVIQPEAKIIQLVARKDVEERLSELESQISQIKSLLILNEDKNIPKNIKEDYSKWARCDSDTRSPPCQGDVIIS